VANKAGASFSIGATSNILFQASGNSYFNGGNVGIKTTTPTVPLEVNGAVKTGMINAAGANINGKITFEGGQGPFCIFSTVCPSQWIDKGTVGFIHSGGGCPYVGGAWYNSGWQWCHPHLCCNQ